MKKNVGRAIGLAFLLFVGALGVPYAASQPAPPPADTSFPDDQGDVMVFGSFPNLAPVPPTEATNYVDLRELRIHGEDLEGLTVTIRLESLAHSTSFDWRPRYEVHFELQGTPTSYQLTWDFGDRYNNYGEPSGELVTEFCTTLEKVGCVDQHVAGSVDMAASTLSAYISKTALMGRNPLRTVREEGPSPLPPSPPPNTTRPQAEGDDGLQRRPGGTRTIQNGPAPEISLPAGARLGNFEVSARGSTTFLSFQDCLPDDCFDGGVGPYVLRRPAANVGIRVEVLKGENQTAGFFEHERAQPGYPTLPATPGESSILQLRVGNHATGKRLVRLAAEVLNGSDAPKWELRVAPMLQIPANDSRVITLIVNATDRVQHGDTTPIRVLATSLTDENEVGAIRLLLVASVPPRPTQPSLYFHASNSPTPIDDFGRSFCMMPILGGGCRPSTWMNTLASDPKANLDEAMAMDTDDFAFTERSSTTSFNLDSPLPRDVVLDVRQPINLTLTFQEAVQGQAEVSLSSDDVYIGGTKESFQATAGQPTVIQFFPMADAQRIHRGKFMELRITIVEEVLTDPGARAATPILVLSQSKLTLPVIVDPELAKVFVPRGNNYVTLSTKQDRHDFVNPGRTKLFRVTVVNEGLAEDLVHVAATAEPATWRARVTPGQTYRLLPGDSVIIGVYGTAPAEAQENDRAAIEVSASSGSDPSKSALLKLGLTVTRGIDIPDEGDAYRIDSDTASKVDHPAKESPGLGVGAFVAAALAAIAVIVRRRRRQ